MVHRHLAQEISNALSSSGRQIGYKRVKGPNEQIPALLERLRGLKAKPGMSLSLFDIGVPMSAVGFTQDQIRTVLNALEQNKT
jgi:hypothetical protein